jgi:hypothetical protein
MTNEETIKPISSLYKEWTENPEDVIEPTAAKEVFVTVPSLLPFVDPYIDEFCTIYNGKDYYGRGFHITDYSNFMKAFNELPQRKVLDIHKRQPMDYTNKRNSLRCMMI